MKNKPYDISGMLVDVTQRRIFPAVLTIAAGKIINVREDLEVDGPYLVPGLIDAHVHIESSMLVPAEFARLAVVHGTVATVSDPHEIANVMGVDGIKFMISNAGQTPFKFYFGAPSCVPATIFESSGASLGLKETEALLEMPEISYLSEMMNFPGVLYEDPQVMGKIELAHKYDKVIDGHAPGMGGSDLVKYAAAGISTDHECSTIAEAREKIKAGMHILIREGSAARNFEELIPLIHEFPDWIMFCSDDKHPGDLVNGHINLLVKRALNQGHDLFDVLCACTLNPMLHYGLDAGLLRPGDPADFIMVGDLTEFNILGTFIDGIMVAGENESFLSRTQEKAINNFSARSINIEDLRVPAREGKIKVQQAIDGQLVTGCLLLDPLVENGQVCSDTGRDILKILVMNRYSPSLPSVGFVNSFGLKRGALASTVAHDSHNIIAVGADDENIVKAVNMLVGSRGGMAVSDGSESLLLPLPVGGIMTDDNGYHVAAQFAALDEKARQMGSQLSSPFMTLSFMALLVIPELKISDKGLFDGKEFKFADLYE